MKVKLLLTGKTNSDYLKAGIDDYAKRLKHYLPFEMVIISELKNNRKMSEVQQKKKEGELIMAQINSPDFVVLLDENGSGFASVEFSEFIRKKMISGLKSMVFVIGGPYGFSDEMYKRSDFNISLSKMTFSHQMVRLIFVEQFYRAMTILKGEPYHHK
ncbi:MAG: 23S rRNA (pseudouridine(1915)-N(3))-methyltransferase RlmH [Bacteroidales bacterium]|nr:23S rRNA (pseudouridine(1915)-N(3))-methyltransferase RlmH [Bacteroidales bacterium]